MRRLVYGAQARRDIGDIVDWLVESLVSAETIRRFAVDLDEACRRLAANPATIGRIRDDLSSDLRSISFRKYLIFFRYSGDRLEVVRVVHGARDLLTLFRDERSGRM